MPESFSRRDLGYFADILIYAREAVEYSRGISKPAFLEGGLETSAVMYCLILIGEATKSLSSKATEEVPEIEWPQIARFRDLAIHHYRHTDFDRVWDIVAEDLPTTNRCPRTDRATAGG